MINILTVTKGVASAAASLGVGTVVGNAVKATTPLEITKYQKVIVGVGSLALTGLVSEMVSRRTEEKVEEISNTFGYPKDAEVTIEIDENK